MSGLTVGQRMQKEVAEFGSVAKRVNVKKYIIILGLFIDSKWQKLVSKTLILNVLT